MKQILAALILVLCATACNDHSYISVIRPLEGEKWWGGIMNDGYLQPYEDLEEFNL